MSLKSSSLIGKLLFIVTIILLFGWIAPTSFNYYKNIKKYEIVNSQLSNRYNSYNIVDKAEKFTVDKFKKDIESIFSDTIVKIGADGEYHVTIQIDKTNIEEFNKFIERLSLTYLVKIRENELNFKDKTQFLEVQFILEEL